MAAPGMLQSGVSRQLFDRWASNKENGVVIAGYSVEGTLAKQILSEPDEVRTQEGRAQPRRCTVVSVSFSAHVDFFQNLEFVEATRPDNIVLVHGEKNEMDRLKGKLIQETSTWPADRRPTVSSPENGQPVKMRFPRDRRVACVGATVVRSDGDGAATKKRRGVRAGVLVSRDLGCTLYPRPRRNLESRRSLDVGSLHGIATRRPPRPASAEGLHGRTRRYADDELFESSPLSVTTLAQTLRLRLAAATASFEALLRQTFADVVDGAAIAVPAADGASEASWTVAGVSVAVFRLENDQRDLVLAWDACPLADVVADAV